MLPINLDLLTIPCPKCGHLSIEVIHAESNVRKGWYCDSCKHFEPALMRERVMEKREK